MRCTPLTRTCQGARQRQDLWDKKKAQQVAKHQLVLASEEEGEWREDNRGPLSEDKQKYGDLEDESDLRDRI